MKVLKKNHLTIIYAMVFIILMQSCRVYHKKPVHIDKAVLEAKRVKITTKAGKKLKFRSIYFNGKDYYGVNKKKGEYIKTVLDLELIKSVRTHNKTMSVIYGVGLVYLLSFAIFILTWEGPNINFEPLQFPN